MSQKTNFQLTMAPLALAVSWYLSIISLTQGTSPVLVGSDQLP